MRFRLRFLSPGAGNVILQKSNLLFLATLAMLTYLGCAAPVENQRAKALRQMAPRQAIAEISKRAHENQVRCKRCEITGVRVRTADSLLELAQKQRARRHITLACLNYDRANLNYELATAESTIKLRNEHIRRLEPVIVRCTEERRKHEKLVQKVKAYEEVIKKLEDN